MTAFLIDFGPLFIPLFFFPFTKRWFDGWLTALMSGVLVQIFMLGLSALFARAMDLVLTLVATDLKNAPALAKIDGGIVVGQLMLLLVAAVMAAIFVVVAPGMVYVAARIAGGAHVGVENLSMPSWLSGRKDADQTPQAPPAQTSDGAAPDAGHRSYAFNRNVGSVS